MTKDQRRETRQRLETIKIGDKDRKDEDEDEDEDQDMHNEGETNADPIVYTTEDIPNPFQTVHFQLRPLQRPARPEARQEGQIRQSKPGQTRA